MKKLIFSLSAFLFLLSAFTFKISAFQTAVETSEYLNDTTITINLTAKPQGDENAVSISLIAEGMTILNYTPPSSSEWIGNTPDCENRQVYSSDRVCTSMAKTDPIEEGESLGTITVKVSGSTYASLTKTSDSAYSDGNSIRTDSGVLVEFNTRFEPAPTTTSQNISLSNIQPLIIVAALVVVVILILLMLWPRIKRRFQKPEPTTTTPF